MKQCSYGILDTFPRHISELERVHYTLSNPQDWGYIHLLKCIRNKGRKNDRAKVIKTLNKTLIPEGGSSTALNAIETGLYELCSYCLDVSGTVFPKYLTSTVMVCAVDFL